MIIVYGLGLVIAMLGGGIVGLLLMAVHHERAAAQQREYENEVAQCEDLYIAAQAILRHSTGVSGEGDAG